MKKLWIAATLFATVIPAAAALDDPNRVTIPTVASIVGAAPFFSDVRVFNTSYDSTVSITATYRCFIGACSGGAHPIDITLPPRQSVAFNDVVANAFAAPNSAGAVELEVTSGGTGADVGVTSRLYSTSPTPTVGMLVQGVPDSAARATTFLGQIANGGAGRGFRTNAGAYNGGDAAVSAVFDVFNDQARSSERRRGRSRRTPASRSTTCSRRSAGRRRRSTTRSSSCGAAATCSASRRDRQRDDRPVPGHRQRGQGGSSGIRAGPAPQDVPSPTPTRTATPAPTPTPTPQAAQTVVVNVGQGGLRFVDQLSGNSTTTIHVGDTVRWVWVGGSHSTTSGSCQGGCHPDGLWDSGTGSGMTFSRTFTQAGTFAYHCIPHGSSMTGVVQVQ